MLPVIALVGRPNVGKSTLFNRLTRSRDALVADEPGLTRDRKYGRGKAGKQHYIVIDTGGMSGDSDAIDTLIADQAMQAVMESQVVLFLVDAREGLLPGDEEIARRLRATGKTIYLLVNKTESLNKDSAIADFHALGLGVPLAISSAHGEGVSQMLEYVLEGIHQPESAAEEEETRGIRIAVVGRPNAGKSTLVNRILGEERVVAFDKPGTTRDSIFIPFERENEHYVMIDTAGVRRRSRITEKIEKFSIIKTLQAIDAANVVILVIDASEDVTDQDLHLLGYILESGRALVIGVNKWDGLSSDDRQRIKDSVDRKLAFVNFADIHYISALHGTGVGNLFDSVKQAYHSAIINIKTNRLSEILNDAVAAHPPPLVRGRRIKLRYAHQGGQNPPLIVIHGNQTARVPEAYRRYLSNTFRKILKIHGTPLRIEFKSGENPFKNKKNKLTVRQLKQRRRGQQRTKSWKKK